MAANSETFYTFKANLTDLTTLNLKLKEATANLARLKAGTAAFNAQSKSIGVMSGQMNTATASSKKLVGGMRTMNATGNKMIGIFKSASIAIVSAFAFRAIIGSLRGVIKTFSDFESQMAAVKAISGATGKEFDKLRESALELGRTTVFTATQVAKLQEEYARLGFTSEEILAAQSGTLALAAGTGEALAKAAESAGSTLRVFGLDARDTTRVADIMGASFTNSALNLERFTQSMKFVGPIARAAGFTLEEVSAQLMVLADNGLHGSIAGNGLKNILLRLGDANSKLNKHLGRTVQGLPQMIQALREMKDESFGLTEATELLDKRSAPAFIALINNIDGLEGSLDTLNNAEGVIAKMAAIRLNNLEGDFLLLKSATEGLGVAVGEVFNIGLRNAINSLTVWVQGITASDSAMNNLRVGFNMAAMAIKLLLIRFAALKLMSFSLAGGFKGLLVGLRMMVVGFRTFGFTVKGATMALRGFRMALASTGVGLLIVAIGVLAELFMSLNDEMGENEMMTQRLTTAIREDINAINDLIAGTSERSNALRKLKQDHMDVLKNMDVEIMKAEDLIRLNKILTKSAQLRVEIAKLTDIVAGITEEEKGKIRLIKLNMQADKLMEDQGKMSRKLFVQRRDENQKLIDDIWDNAATHTLGHELLLEQKKKELEVIMTSDKKLNKFRILTEKSYRLRLRKGYRDEVELFREKDYDEQKIELDGTNKKIETLEIVQTYLDMNLLRNEYRATHQTDLANELQIEMDALKKEMIDTGAIHEVDEAWTKWKGSGEKLTITIEELRTKINGFNAGLKRNVDLGDKTVEAQAIRLQRTKENWKELNNLQVSNIKDANEREIATINTSHKNQVKKYNDENKIIKANQTSIKSYMDGTDKHQDKLNKSFIKKNKKNYEVLKNTTADGWKKINAEGQAGVDERARILGIMYQEEQHKFKTNTSIIVQLGIEQEKKITAAKIDHEVKRQAAIQAKVESGWEQQSTDLIHFFKINKEKVKNAKSTAADQLKIAKRRKDAGILNEEQYAARVEEINNELSQKLNDLEDERLEKIAATAGMASAIMMEFADNLFAFHINKRNEQYESDRLAADEKFAGELEKAEAAGADTAAMTKTHNDKMIALEDKKDEDIRKLQKKQFRLKKANDVAMAIINGAVAITAVSSQTGIGAIVAAPIMSTLIAAQIAMILSRKFVGELGGIVPKGIDLFGLGGITADEKFAKGGMVHGPSHKQGGVKFNVGGRVSELEGGEAVINRRSTAMFRDQLSTMNVAGGGVRFEQGGLTPGTRAALDGAKGNWTANDIATLIAGSISSQQVYVSETDITSTQSNVQIHETMATIF